MNLILNAIEAMEKGGKLLIRTKILEDKKMTAIEFTDTGVGIPKENLSQIFEPFFTTKAKGTGMGLPVVFGIVSRHKGEIEIESVIGKGTTVTIELPVNDQSGLQFKEKSVSDDK